jgi:hypothetical protein
MHSPTAIAFRALLMLLCLVSVPLLAIFGKDLPEQIRTLLDRHLSRSQAAPLAGAPPTVGGLTMGTYGQTPTLLGQSPGSTSQEAALFTSGQPIAPDASMSAGIQPPHAWPDYVAGGPTPPPSPPLAAPNMPTAEGIHPVGRDPREMYSPSGPPTCPVPPAGTSGTALTSPAVWNGAAPPAAQPEVFREVEHRLRQLGATYYLLETWGPRNDRYRFYCKMAIAGDSGVNRCFQATDSDPLRAMQEVLHQVEAWRSGRDFF